VNSAETGRWDVYLCGFSKPDFPDYTIRSEVTFDPVGIQKSRDSLKKCAIRLRAQIAG
jgi:hypothetical protein